MSTAEPNSWNFSSFNRTIDNWSNTGILSNFIAGNIYNNNFETLNTVNMNTIHSGKISSNNLLNIETASNLYIEGPVVSGDSNTTITNSYSLYVATGSSYFGGPIVQSNNRVAIGQNAGNTGQGSYSIAIGYNAGSLDQPANSIIINATGTGLNTSTSGFFVKPIRNVNNSAFYTLKYNSISKEISYDDNNSPTGNTGPTGPQFIYIDNGNNLMVGQPTITPVIGNSYRRYKKEQRYIQ